MATISPILEDNLKETLSGRATSTMRPKNIPSPKTLINFTFFVVAFCALALVIILRMTPYTGFDLIPAVDSEDGYSGLVVSRADDWVVDAGLSVGDRVVRIESNNQSLALEAKHVPRSTFEARDYYESREERIKEIAKVYERLKHSTIIIVLQGGEKISLDLDVERPLTSVQSRVWLQYFFGLLAWFIGALVWSFQPTRRETMYLMLSGLGLFFVSFPGALSTYHIEMFYLNSFLLWFVTVSVGIGDFLFIGFGACVLLYFPQRLPGAHRWGAWLLGGLGLYAVVTLLNNWQTDLAVTEQFLYYSYNETYLPMPFFYGIVLCLCFRQVKTAKTKPVERAQALWITLAWTLGPSVFNFLYLVPVVVGNEPLLSQTWTTLALLSSFWMVLIGVARFQMFHLEKYIGVAYQWTFVSLLFFGLDFFLVTATQVGPQISTIVVVASVLWIYLPIRQWIHNRISNNRQAQYQQRFSESVAMMVQDSLKPNNQPSSTWQLTLQELFAPLQINPLQRDDKKNLTFTSQRGQSLNIPANAFSGPIQLSYAENGSRLFTDQDKTFASTLAVLFERLYEFRDAYLSGQTQERERIRRDLHDQIGHKLLTMIYAAPDQAHRKLAQETMEQLRELIRALKDEPVSLPNALIQIRQICEEACANIDITLHWQDTIDDLDDSTTLLSTNQYLNTLNIIRELLNNTIRHAKASTLEISVRFESGVLSINLTDNGVGFDQENVIAGNGLHNIDSRVKEIGAKINWQTNSGTHVCIDIPITS
jgi:signal transduction histidine kinase